MDIHQLKTFVAVAREGSVTRASEILHLSQPAVSAHIKAIEDAFDLALFERTSRGMTLTTEGQRLLARAEQTLTAHQGLMEEASRLKGSLTGHLRVGAGSNSNNEAIGRLVTALSERCPEVQVILKHGTSQEILAGIRNGSLDAGLYNEAGEPGAELTTVEVSRFKTHLVAPPGLIATSEPLNWAKLERLPWIYPASSACCGRTAETLFSTHHIRPKRIISVDRESVTQTLISGGLGIGLLHAGTSDDAQSRGEVELLAESPSETRILFAHLATRATDPLLQTASAILGEHLR